MAGGDATTREEPAVLLVAFDKRLIESAVRRCVLCRDTLCKSPKQFILSNLGLDEGPVSGATMKDNPENSICFDAIVGRFR